jgi:hypothetical protein
MSGRSVSYAFSVPSDGGMSAFVSLNSSEFLRADFEATKPYPEQTRLARWSSYFDA